MVKKKSAPRERRYWRHWSWMIDKVLAGLFGLAIVVGACLVIDLDYVPWLPFLALVPVGWLVIQIVWWRCQYLHFDSNRLVFHRLPWDIGEYINYSFTDWHFDQKSLWAKLWNYGTLKVGQHTFERFWPYRQLADALRVSPTPGIAPAQPVAQPDVASQPVFIFVPIRERDFAPERTLEPPSILPALPRWENDGYAYYNVPFEADHHSYAGFLATCEEFLFPTGRLDVDACVSQDPRRRYYPQGMSRGTALFYCELLQRTRIIDNEGRLFSRIRSIDDVRQRVPYFEAPYHL
jgi:hypothetical protein